MKISYTFTAIVIIHCHYTEKFGKPFLKAKFTVTYFYAPQRMQTNFDGVFFFDKYKIKINIKSNGNKGAENTIRDKK
jgi:hypothetical protein